MLASDTGLPGDTIGLLEGLTTTRAVRRYADKPVTDEQLRAVLFAATRAPSGSNRQPYRFLVLTDGPKATEAKELIAGAAVQMWEAKRRRDSYDSGSGKVPDSPKSRMAAAMQDYVDGFGSVPVLVLPGLVRYRDAGSFEGASIYPACQNILLAARSLGLGGVISGFHFLVERELRDLLSVPQDVFLAATITIGWPRGKHGPVRRRPMRDLVFEESWGEPPEWAMDPPGTRFSSGGPPRSAG